MTVPKRAPPASRCAALLQRARAPAAVAESPAAALSVAPRRSTRLFSRASVAPRCGSRRRRLPKENAAAEFEPPLHPHRAKFGPKALDAAAQEVRPRSVRATAASRRSGGPACRVSNASGSAARPRPASDLLRRDVNSSRPSALPELFENSTSAEHFAAGQDPPPAIRLAETVPSCELGKSAPKRRARCGPRLPILRRGANRRWPIRRPAPVQRFDPPVATTLEAGPPPARPHCPCRPVRRWRVPRDTAALRHAPARMARSRFPRNRVRRTGETPNAAARVKGSPRAAEPAPAARPVENKRLASFPTVVSQATAARRARSA